MKPLYFTLLLLVGTAFAQEEKLIAVLKSDAPLKEKADACEALVHTGTRQAVPALAPQRSAWIGPKIPEGHTGG